MNLHLYQQTVRRRDIVPPELQFIRIVERNNVKIVVPPVTLATAPRRLVAHVAAATHWTRRIDATSRRRFGGRIVERRSTIIITIIDRNFHTINFIFIFIDHQI
uniref:Uncharacterized protein n=1 Tax=Romanomermis culicivorax TaxID=13658 RepID=A0A915JUF5_ROMCU